MASSPARNDSQRETWVTRQLRDRTALGGSSALLLVVSGYLLGGSLGLVASAVAAVAWLGGRTPLAIAVAVIGATGTTKPAETSTLITTTTAFPGPELGVGLLGLGIIGLSVEPLVAASHLRRSVGIAGVFTAVLIGGMLAVARFYGFSVWSTAAALAVITVFFAGALNRVVVQLIRSPGAADE